MNKTRWIMLLAALIVLLAGGGWYINGRMEAQEEAASSGEVLIGGPFRLTNQNGESVTEQNFQGKFMLVYFGYTFCPDVCPTELQIMTSALGELGTDASNVVPIFVTVDPEHDTVAVMADYVKHFSPRLVGLTGTAEQIAAAAKAYRVFYQKVTDDSATGGYSMDHSSIIYLMGPDGRFIEHFGPGTTPEQMAAGIRKYL
ncbi:MAG: SCO family protein [Parvibaculaceae bacterium]|nr:SCO family protein [Parvibaculaceae bacterium]